MKKPGKPTLPAAEQGGGCWRASRIHLDTDVGRAVHSAQAEHRDKDSMDKHA